MTLPDPIGDANGMHFTEIMADCGHKVRVSGSPGPHRVITACPDCSGENAVSRKTELRPMSASTRRKIELARANRAVKGF